MVEPRMGATKQRGVQSENSEKSEVIFSRPQSTSPTGPRPRSNSPCPHPHPRCPARTASSISALSPPPSPLSEQENPARPFSFYWRDGSQPAPQEGQGERDPEGNQKGNRKQGEKEEIKKPSRPKAPGWEKGEGERQRALGWMVVLVVGGWLGHVSQASRQSQTRLTGAFLRWKNT